MATERLVISGYSDDLIEVEGDIRAEFEAPTGPAVLAFSDGTVLRIVYDDHGSWRITLVAFTPGLVAVEQCPEDDDINYTDRARIFGDAPITWVVLGTEVVRRTQP